jgi:hypothetical protein
MIIVKVYHESSGDPAIGKIVSLGGEKLGSAGGQFTDNDGEVLFNVGPFEGRIFIFVNGSIAYRGYLREKIVIYV